MTETYLLHFLNGESLEVSVDVSTTAADHLRSGVLVCRDWNNIRRLVPTTSIKYMEKTKV